MRVEQHYLIFNEVEYNIDEYRYDDDVSPALSLMLDTMQYHEIAKTKRYVKYGNSNGHHRTAMS